VPETEVTCWVAGSTGAASGGIEGLPVEAGLPLPGSPGSLSIGQAICSPNLQGGAVPLSWGDAGNETGYRLYRNGSLVATLGASATDYDDRAPRAWRCPTHWERSMPWARPLGSRRVLRPARDDAGHHPAPAPMARA